jgi:hypothetical protein
VSVRLEHPANSGHAYLVNEGRGLRKDVIQQLLVLPERIPAHVVIAFTTAREGLALLGLLHITPDLSTSSSCDRLPLQGSLVHPPKSLDER